ncbi:MAG: hypothetical protein BIFFINMI_02984 [Phycisphaerae bacterium]|nr:hypothetical protein [Phycisphaerae bacterium]
MASDTLTEAQWRQYERDGYLHLGRLLDDRQLAAMQQRLDDIMLGKADIDYGRMLMQLDSETGKYEDAGVQSRGHKGATLNYRKIQDLEIDPLFLAFIRRPLFHHICRRVHGPGPIGLFRAMFMNKPAGKGTWLPWHQDRWTDLDRDPQITIWLALDPATRANGCVQIIPGSHHELLNPEHASGFLTEQMAAERCTGDRVRYVELKPGEAMLLHNWLLHASDRNQSSQSRRAFSICYMDGHSVSKRGENFFPVFDADSEPANA